MDKIKKLNHFLAYKINDQDVIEACDPDDGGIRLYDSPLHPDIAYTIRVLKDVAMRSESGTINANFVYQLCQVMLNQAGDLNER